MSKQNKFTDQEIRKLNELTNLKVYKKADTDQEVYISSKNIVIGTINRGNIEEDFYPVFFPESSEFPLGSDRLKCIAKLMDSIGSPS